jgi:hypothetical protein
MVVRASVWLAMLCCPAGPAGRRWRPELCRAIWTLGCVAFLVHVASSFAVHYGWSHTIALRETARQTAEMVGRPVGAGLYVNYLFAALWVLDAAWWWCDRRAHRERRAWVDLALHSLFLFILFNGGVVFARGPARWIGAAATIAGVAALVGAHAGEREHRRRAAGALPGTAR